jgi:hypothetical protein
MTGPRDETTITEDVVREEHQRSASPTAHWAYLVGVLVGGLVLMVALIAVLGSS